MSNAAKGRRSEYKAREWLESLGYSVTRSAASKGAWDLIGINKYNVVLAQVKTNRWPGREETLAIENFIAPWGTRKVIIRVDDRAEVKVKELERLDGFRTRWVSVV